MEYPILSTVFSDMGGVVQKALSSPGASLLSLAHRVSHVALYFLAIAISMHLNPTITILSCLLGLLFKESIKPVVPDKIDRLFMALKTSPLGLVGCSLLSIYYLPVVLACASLYTGVRCGIYLSDWVDKQIPPPGSSD